MTKQRVQESKLESVESAIDVLRSNDISVLYYFTDAANLQSIREHGLLCFLPQRAIPESSHEL